jgi:hypothetical protein
MCTRVRHKRPRVPRFRVYSLDGYVSVSGSSYQEEKRSNYEVFLPHTRADHLPYIATGISVVSKGAREALQRGAKMNATAADRGGLHPTLKIDCLARLGDLRGALAEVERSCNNDSASVRASRQSAEAFEVTSRPLSVLRVAS